MGILELVGVVVCAMVWYVCREELAEQRASELAWRKESILTEAEGVIMDFLDYGREVAEVSRGKYRGTISIRMYPVDRSGELGFCVSMYGCGDLMGMDADRIDAFHLTAFVKKYGYYYDPERDAIVYQTSRGANLLPGEKELLTNKLMRRIQNHPLAIVKSENRIATKGVGS